MITLVLMFLIVAVVTATMFLSMRVAFFLFVFLYGVYPKFLAVGIGEQGFALTGARALVSLLFLGYLGRLLLDDPDARRGLGALRRESSLALAIVALITAKILGNVTAGQWSLGSFAALADEVMLVAFVFVLAVTYVRTLRDLYILFACVAGSVIVNELAMMIEFIRGGSVFYDIVEIQYETETERNLIAGRIRDGTYRMMGLMPNPLVLASLFCIALPGMLALASQKKDGFLKAIAIAGLVGIGPALIATFARGGIVLGFFVVSFAALLLLTRNLDRPLRMTAMLLGGSAALIVLILGGQELLTAIVSTGGDQAVRSAQSRVLQYAAAMPVLFDHPVFGVGYARNYDVLLGVGNIDGHYLRTTLQGGIAGLLAIGWALLRGIRITAVTSNMTGLAPISLAVRASILVIATLMVFYSQHNTAAYLAIFLAAAVTVSQLDRSVPEKGSPLPLLMPGTATG
jgi:hypothetical protein